MNAQLPPSQRPPTQLPDRQQGMVLIVCLLVVAVVTLIVTSATETSSYEEKMATSAQTYNRTFQAAETAVEYGVDVEAMMFEAMDDANNLSASAAVPVNTDDVSASAQTEYLGEGIAPGNSLGTSSTFRFEIRGEGEMSKMDASTLIRQGFYRVSFVASTNE